MAENHIRMLCAVIKVDLVYESPEGKLTAFFDSVPDSPLMQSAPLRQRPHAAFLHPGGDPEHDPSDQFRPEKQQSGK